MKAPIVLIGMGEMGGVFARGFLKLGHAVYPLRRNDDMARLADDLPTPEAVVIAVGESDLQPVLNTLPAVWKDRLVLLQNELLPRDWAHLPTQPTVISVWFEKKKGQDAKVIIPSPVYGPLAQFVADALAAVDIPVKLLSNEAELLFELVVKNLYILTANIAGLEVGGTVGELWSRHRDVAEAVVNDVIQLQQQLTGQEFDREALIKAMLTAFDGDPAHQCMGRSAPARLQRAVEQAAEANLMLSKLPQIKPN